MRSLRQQLQQLVGKSAGTPAPAANSKHSDATQRSSTTRARQEPAERAAAVPRPAPSKAATPATKSVTPVTLRQDVKPPPAAAEQVKGRAVDSAPRQVPEQAPPSSGPPRTYSRQPARFNLGLDFGTSTTKGCVRRALGPGARVPTVALNWLGNARADGHLLPSSVGVAKGKLFFGFEAERPEVEHVFRRFKVCLACQVDGTCPARRCPNEASTGGATGNRTPGLVAAGYSIRPRDLLVLYLANAMRRALEVVPPDVLGAGPVLYTCTLGVPVDHGDPRRALGRAFTDAARDAWLLKEHVHDGVSVEQAVGWVRHVEASGGPHRADDLVMAQPESLAAAMAYFVSPSVRQGMYSLIDVGAWTTDISVFRVSAGAAEDGGNSIAVYEATTTRAAAGGIDERHAELLREYWSAQGHADAPRHLTEVLGHLREGGRSSDGVVSCEKAERPVCPSAAEFARSLVGQQVARAVVDTMKAARRKETHLSAKDWKDVRLFTLGGGSEEPAFSEAIRSRLGEFPLAPLHQVNGVQWGGEPLPEVLERRMHVAAGLAVPAATWAKWFPPSEVDVPGPSGPTPPEWGRDPYSK